MAARQCASAHACAVAPQPDACSGLQGNLRWRSPQKIKPWANTVNATWWRPGCPQKAATFWNILSGTDEACLYLNIYVPSGTPPPGGFPVLFFIHGM
ncbi:hypothetical protein EON62_05120 [archaeon]|nr:MAG: hypothetical protein EON62_05120 [archaeon]